MGAFRTAGSDRVKINIDGILVEMGLCADGRELWSTNSIVSSRCLYWQSKKAEAASNSPVVQYKGEYHANHPTILAFWEAFFELSVQEKKQFLQFLMGSTRLPVGGMSSLQMFIQPTAPEVLPVAHTCFNLLDLPNIADSRELLRRLRISIQYTQGFTLV
ncbi:unnamed protein product [Nippostrongylus brasiliensis]|uniref:HECT-type E3 ubiquitin transferase n=1 Tax=Nippostrongylus brasiliensis TaxID=27835 RepID=A0A0N4Y571_NIPBR|nr:unnamed protein product [Nippostrongylus brasiliensis]